MSKLEATFFDLGALDTLAARDTAVHRLDPRAKVLTTLVFVVTVVSFGKYQISALLPFAVFPLSLIALGDLPPAYLLKKLLLALPFALFVGVFNPFLDREILLQVGPVALSGGWVSFFSILLRFVLTVTAALVLIAVTSFSGVCMALERLGMPRPFALQLLFLYRYIFVLVEEASRMVRARALRTFRGRGQGLRVFGALLGQLLLRTLERAQRIHLAMLCRAFDGEIRMLRPMRFGIREWGFTLGWSGLFVLLRLYNLPQLMGTVLTGLGR